MNQEVRKMLENMYNIFSKKFKDEVIAWDHFIDFLAVDNCGSLIYQFRHKFEWLFEDNKLVNSLMSIYNPALLRSDYYDHLGEMYFEKILNPKQSQDRNLSLMTMNDAYTMAKMSFGETDAPLKILDPVVGSGRYLMAVYKIAPNALLFGVDTDLRALRIAFTNFAIHGIQGYLLHADTRIHDTEIDTDEGIYNWQFANKWYSHIDKLKTKIKDKIQKQKILL